MPNWCNATYVFYVDYKKDFDQLVDFWMKIKEYTSKSRIKNDFGDGWLGNIVDGFGFNYDEIECRGEVSCEPLLTRDSVEFDTETAWSPMTEMWDAIIKKFYPAIKYVYMAEVPENNLYINTDKYRRFFDDNFVVDNYEIIDGEPVLWDRLYFVDADYMINWVNGEKDLGFKITNMSELMMYCQHNNDLKVHKFVGTE